MLAKVESLMIREGCIRSMACIASTRESMMEWIERRKYTAIGATPYPADALKHSLTSEDVGLIRFIKCLRKSIEDPSNFVLSSIDEKKTNDSEKPPQINTHLPPAWRYAIPSENDAGID